MIHRIEALDRAGISFGLGTTHAARLTKLIASGYQFQLVFQFLPLAALAVARVANRVVPPGHNVPEATVRRRFDADSRNVEQPIPLQHRFGTKENKTTCS
jgi:predicted ABC-type ATPase